MSGSIDDLTKKKKKRTRFQTTEAKGGTLRPHVFDKGVSGNPSGRPKNLLNAATIVKMFFNCKINTKNLPTHTQETLKMFFEAKGSQLTLREIALMHQIKKAVVDGDGPALAYLLKLCKESPEDNAPIMLPDDDEDTDPTKLNPNQMVVFTTGEAQRVLEAHLLTFNAKQQNEGKK